MSDLNCFFMFLYALDLFIYFMFSLDFCNYYYITYDYKQLVLLKEVALKIN